MLNSNTNSLNSCKTHIICASAGISTRSRIDALRLDRIANCDDGLDGLNKHRNANYPHLLHFGNTHFNSGNMAFVFYHPAFIRQIKLIADCGANICVWIIQSAYNKGRGFAITFDSCNCGELLSTFSYFTRRTGCSLCDKLQWKTTFSYIFFGEHGMIFVITKSGGRKRFRNLHRA